MARTDYFNDPHAPKANSIVPASAIVTNDEGKYCLLVCSKARVISTGRMKSMINSFFRLEKRACGERAGRSTERIVQEEIDIMALQDHVYAYLGRGKLPLEENHFDYIIQYKSSFFVSRTERLSDICDESDECVRPIP